MDNLWAHKSTYIMRIIQDLQLEMLYTPSNTPEFSPIENMFGMAKVRLKDQEFKTKEELTKAVIKTFYSLKPHNINGFFKKTLDNILKYWLYLDRSRWNI